MLIPVTDEEADAKRSWGVAEAPVLAGTTDLFPTPRTVPGL